MDLGLILWTALTTTEIDPACWARNL